MAIAQKRKRWSTGEDLVRSFRYRAGMEPDRMAILSAVWDKEVGPFAGHWALVGVKKGILYVKPRSSAAAQELHLRGGQIVRSLNKYFSRAWIKAVKTSAR